MIGASTIEEERQALTLPPSVSSQFLVHHRLCPTQILDDGRVEVAVTDDSVLDGLDDLELAYYARVSPQVVDSARLDRLIERFVLPDMDELELEAESEYDEFTSDVRDLANQVPVVRYVNLLIREAHDAGASDIHLESGRTGLNARIRLDGVLLDAPEPPRGLGQAVLSRVKLLADLDIAERRRPQDGRIRVRLAQRELDLRVSSVPNMFGESVVLRLLDRGGGRVDLHDLGLGAQFLDGLSQLARQPHGLFLATGPTGSGKTTTLYAALGLRDPTSEKIITVEDPVEYVLTDVTQVPVQRRAGVTFASMLRSILRQDPDVVMVGEMRDAETADLAVQAALTGHMVFSTLHTNDAIGAIPRLRDLGVPPFLIAATLDGVLAQRLVRRVCRSCGGRRCPECRGTGFLGRTGIFELLVVTTELREAIGAGAPQATIEQLARAGGMRDLVADGQNKVDRRITTMEEVRRATRR